MFSRSVAWLLVCSALITTACVPTRVDVFNASVPGNEALGLYDYCGATNHVVVFSLDPQRPFRRDSYWRPFDGGAPRIVIFALGDFRGARVYVRVLNPDHPEPYLDLEKFKALDPATGSALTLSHVDSGLADQSMGPMFRSSWPAEALDFVVNAEDLTAFNLILPEIKYRGTSHSFPPIEYERYAGVVPVPANC